jgi:O-acetyl-ADP-ribose deacetylase (regulator of RNase III)
MTNIQYVARDATRPTAPGNKIIVHICNDRGGWGKGFVTAISARWPEPEDAYRRWFDEKSGFDLGAVGFVQVEPDIWIANLIGQIGLREKNGVPPIRYEAVRTGLERVASKSKELNASVHMPRIGCGLAGGKWSEIEPIIVETLCNEGIATTVYDLG